MRTAGVAGRETHSGVVAALHILTMTYLAPHSCAWCLGKVQG